MARFEPHLAGKVSSISVSRVIKERFSPIGYFPTTLNWDLGSGAWRGEAEGRVCAGDLLDKS